MKFKKFPDTRLCLSCISSGKKYTKVTKAIQERDFSPNPAKVELYYLCCCCTCRPWYWAASPSPWQGILWCVENLWIVLAQALVIHPWTEHIPPIGWKWWTRHMILKRNGHKTHWGHRGQWACGAGQGWMDNHRLSSGDRLPEGLNQSFQWTVGWIDWGVGHKICLHDLSECKHAAVQQRLRNLGSERVPFALLTLLFTYWQLAAFHWK